MTVGHHHIKTNTILFCAAFIGILPLLISTFATFHSSLAEISPHLGLTFLLLIALIAGLLSVMTVIGTTMARTFDLQLIEKGGVLAGFFASVGLVVLVGGLALASRLFVPAAGNFFPHLPLVYIAELAPYHALTQEIVFRWFGFSVIAALATALHLPRKIAAAGAILLTGIAAGFLSLPSSTVHMQWLSNPQTTTLGIAIFAVPQLVYGVLYWKKGLASAMLAHGLTFAMVNCILYLYT